MPYLSGQHPCPTRFPPQLVFPHLFVSYAQIGPIWVEDMCIMCRDPPDPAACPPLPPLEYNITSHDDLLSAVQTLGSTDFGECQDRTAVLQLRNNLVIDAQRWPDNGVFLTSNVTFRCPPGAMTVFDFGGLLDMFKVRGAAYVQFHNLVLANLPLHPVGPFEVPMWQFHYPRWAVGARLGHGGVRTLVVCRAATFACSHTVSKRKEGLAGD